MADQKSKLPDFNEITSMMGKFFKDVKTSIGEIVDEYKAKHNEPEPQSCDINRTPGTSPKVEPKQPIEPNPITKPEPIVAPKPMMEPNPITKPEPIAEPKPTMEPNPIAKPEPIVESKPIKPKKTKISEVDAEMIKSTQDIPKRNDDEV